MNFLFFLWRTQHTGYTLPILSHLERPGCCPHTHFHRKKKRQLKGPALSSHWRVEANSCCRVLHLTLSLTPTEYQNKWLPTHSLSITNQNRCPWLQLPKLLQSWLPTWLHLMDAGDKPKIKHCWQAAVTGTFRGQLEGNQSRKKYNSKEKPLGQRNPRGITETYFKVLREDWQKLLAITKKLMDIFKVSSKHILHIKHMFLYVPSSPPQLVFVPLNSFTFTFYFHVTYMHTCSNEAGERA